MEIWKTVPTYPRYEVSNLGRVRSWASKSSKREKLLNAPFLLAQIYDKSSGYYRVRLHNEAGHKLEFIHVVVLCAFVGPRPDGYHACHNDGDKLNNHLDNLRWDTVQNNHLDKLEHGTMYHGEQHHFTKFVEGDIPIIRQRAANGETHRAIAADYGVSRPAISYIVKRFTWKHVP